jgi:hypothetical protein
MKSALGLLNKPAKTIDKELGLSLALTETEINTLSRSSLFEEIAGIYKTKGMSKWGGICLFIGEFILMGVDKSKQNKSIPPSVNKLIEKLSFTATNMASANDLGLNQPDTNSVSFAFNATEKWMEIHPSKNEMDILINSL